jgi:hypothetical protein
VTVLRAILSDIRADVNRTSTGVAVALVVAGFVVLGLTWRAVADRLDVPLQLPYLVSGGFTGLAVIGAGLGLVNVQVTRRINARRRDQLDRLLDEAAALAARLGSVSDEAGGPRR